MWRTVCSHLFCTYPFLVPLGDPCLLIGTDMYKGTCRSLSIHPVPLKITDLSEQSRLRIPILFSCSLLIWCFWCLLLPVFVSLVLSQFRDKARTECNSRCEHIESKWHTCTKKKTLMVSCFLWWKTVLKKCSYFYVTLTFISDFRQITAFLGICANLPSKFISVRQSLVTFSA